MPQSQAIATKRGIRRWMLPLAALVLAAIVVAPPLISLKGLHHQIAESISQAIGRPVRMSSIKLRLLPRPGFEISDFVVDEDPAFGAEPILRSAQVIASVRLLPLWRGRLEIARISFDEPSLNLVRNREGRWNVDSLLSQAAQIPKAPTGERSTGGLPRFPYISAGNARINFKSGDEKLPFSFFNADLAVWLQNPGEWRIEFAAQPVRTDLSLDLANTGIVRLNGSLRHASRLVEMPMQLHAEWGNAPLGQLSRILTGTDADWRGQLYATADITGTMDQADLKLTANGQSIHRAEFAPRAPLDINVSCEARFIRSDRLLDALTCLVPTGNGHLLLTGSVHASRVKPDPSLSLELNSVPVSSALDALRLFRAGFGNALSATGVINGTFTYAAPAEVMAPQIEGQATVDLLTVTGPDLQRPFVLPPLRFSTQTEPREQPRHGRTAAAPAPSREPAALLLETFAVTPTPVSAAAPQDAKPLRPLTIDGNFDWTGFSIHLDGQSHLGDLISLGKGLGLLHSDLLDFGNQGIIDLDLTAHGPWMLPVSDDPAAPLVLDGTAHIRNAQVTGKFLAQTVKVSAAQAAFAGSIVEWSAPAMTFGPVHADGTLSYPAYCTAPTGCAPNFTLHIDALDSATAQSALLGAERPGEVIQRLLERVRNLNQKSTSWPALEGTLQIGTFTIEQLSLRDLTAELAVKGDAVDIKSASAHTLDGLLHLSGNMKVVNSSPHYELEAQLKGASTAATAALFQESWGSGSIDITTSLNLTGFEQKDLLQSATGTFHWDWTKGGLSGQAAFVDTSSRSKAVTSTPMTHFDNWTGDAAVADGVATIQKSHLQKGSDATTLAGTIGFDRELHLHGNDPSNADQGSISINGSLEHPVVTSIVPASPSGAP